MSVFLRAQWQQLIMANYEVDAAILTPYLPNGVELDLYEGKALVSLVGFLFKDTSIFGVSVPFFGTFEEVNLRFYVTRKMSAETRRGVVFVSESVPNRLVAHVANLLYREHYSAIPTSYQWQLAANHKRIRYSWKVQHKWNSLAVEAAIKSKTMPEGGLEAFIFEHYYGYTRLNSKRSLEYRIHHPTWKTSEVTEAAIDCDFAACFGQQFSCLNRTQPHSVLLADGSDIRVDWKRQPF